MMTRFQLDDIARVIDDITRVIDDITRVTCV